MKIAPEYSISVERTLYVIKIFILSFLLSLFFSFNVLSVSLPRPIGKVNDFANLLSIQDRENIQEWMKPISESNIQLTVLASRRDPYSNPAEYFSKITDKWNIEGGFILFVEEFDGWQTVSFLGNEIRGVLRSKGILESYKDRIEEKTAEGKIREAILFSYKQLSNAITGKVEVDESDGIFKLDSVPVIPFIILGGFLVLLAFYSLLRWEITRRCPKCGVRMNLTNEKPYPSSSYRIITKKCNNCGYRESERVKNKSFWPFGGS